MKGQHSAPSGRKVGAHAEDILPFNPLTFQRFNDPQP
jgi:hypothetical protein